MTRMELHQPTGIPAVDQTLVTILTTIEHHMPDRVQGYYLVGSYAVGEAIPASDIDLLILFPHDLTAADRQQFLAACDQCKRVSRYPLDFTADSATKFHRVGGVWFQTASRFLYGVDIRAQLPRKPIAPHIRDLMHAMYGLLARVRGNPPRLTVPLGYPDRAGGLYGYDQRRIRDGAQLRTVGTKDLVTNTLAIANVLTLRQSGSYVGTGRKADIPVHYQQWCADEWAELVTDAYTCWRNRWGYAIPAATADYAALRQRCQDVLAFENHFLAVYRDYLFGELQCSDAAVVRFAVQRLGQLIYADRAIDAALRQIRHQGDRDLWPEIDATLAFYRDVAQ